MAPALVAFQTPNWLWAEEEESDDDDDDDDEITLQTPDWLWSEEDESDDVLQSQGHNNTEIKEVFEKEVGEFFLEYSNDPDSFVADWLWYWAKNCYFYEHDRQKAQIMFRKVGGGAKDE